MQKRNVHIGLLCVLLCLLAPVAQAQVRQAVSLFDKGNQRYRQGNYRGALNAYQQALDSGYESGALYYNMGNAYYRLDELGQAIRYYEKARRLMPDHPTLQHNLEIARSRTVDQFSQLPEPFWRSWWRRIVSLIGVRGFFFSGLALYLAATALLGYRIWTGTRTPWRRRALTLSLSIGLLFLALAFTASLGKKLDHQAVVVTEQIALQQAPRDDATPELDLHEGVLVDVLQEQGRWAEIRLPNGTTGWVRRQAIAGV